MDIILISTATSLVISFIALGASIYKIFVDKQNFEKQFQSKKEMFDKQLISQRKIFKKQFEAQKEMNNTLKQQIQAQQEILIILKKELQILEVALSENKGRKETNGWEKQFKEQELALKQQKEKWKQFKDVISLLKEIS
jgi:hypothetical protein